MHRNHGQFNILPNGLIEFQLTNPEAAMGTFVNGSLVPEEGKVVLNHLDTIYFGSGAMLLFKYPRMRRIGDSLAQELKDDVPPEEL